MGYLHRVFDPPLTRTLIEERGCGGKEGGREGQLLTFFLRACNQEPPNQGRKYIQLDFTLHRRNRRRAATPLGAGSAAAVARMTSYERRSRRSSWERTKSRLDCAAAAAAAAEDGQFVRGLRNEQVRMRRKGGTDGGKDTARGTGDAVMFLLAMKMRSS